MHKINENCRISLLFSLLWQDRQILHEERFFADRVSLWRDIFPATMRQELLGKSIGERIKVVIDSADFIAPYSEKLVRPIKRDDFVPPPGFHSMVASPLPGRFYPQSYLHNTPGVFAVSHAPCRFVGPVGDALLFDLNHPLAGKELTVYADIIAIEPIGVERGGRCEDWLEAISADGPGMQRRWPEQATDFFRAENLKRKDERSDSIFYQTTRLVQHLDSTARRLLREEYGRILPRDARVLDLMGSWDSHLPATYREQSLTVLGMNRQELEKNERADKYLVHDVNENRQLPFADTAFDAIICTASIEYATDPLQLCREAARILMPGGVIAVSFSNRWFPSKAVAIWSHLHEFERLALVVEMLSAEESFADMKTLSIRGYPRPDDDPHGLPFSDPVYMVTARKNILLPPSSRQP